VHYFTLEIFPDDGEDISDCFRQLAGLGDMPLGTRVEVMFNEDSLEGYLYVQCPKPLTDEHRQSELERLTARLEALQSQEPSEHRAELLAAARRAFAQCIPPSSE
jgi:hypothetical protein